MPGDVTPVKASVNLRVRCAGAAMDVDGRPCDTRDCVLFSNPALIDKLRLFSCSKDVLGRGSPISVLPGAIKSGSGHHCGVPAP